MTVHAVAFDIGEVLVDETGVWSRWADWLGVPRFTFMAALGAVIERGESFRQVFPIFKPDFDLEREKNAMIAAGGFESFTIDELYPDVQPAFAALRDAGFRLAIAGNQPVIAERTMADANLPVEFLVASETWGINKPDPAFFDRVAAELRLPPSAIAYVGDRVDNDVVPAHRAGMVAVFVRRGPWAIVQERDPGIADADIRVGALADLPAALARWNADHAIGGTR